MRNLQVKLLVLILAGAGLGLAYAKIHYLGMPLLPDQESFTWLVEAQIEFNASGGPAVVDFDIPDDLGAYLKLDEFFVSRAYGLNVATAGGNRRVEWSIRRAKGLQRLYYRLELVPEETEKTAAVPKSTPPKAPQKPQYDEPLASAIDDLLNEVRSESADIFTFTNQLLLRLNESKPDATVAVIRKGLERGTDEWVERIRFVLAGARITTRLVRGVILEDGSSKPALTPWLEVHNGDRWSGFDPVTGNKGYPPDFLRWSVGSDPLLSVRGGRKEHIAFSTAKRPRALTDIARERAEVTDSPLLAWSLFGLPLSAQNVYRVLLAVPIGALIVVLMRSLVGIPTFGTFMPVLVALAFRETELLWGIGMLCVVVATGLSLRFYLERLQLLLVPRLSAVLVIVIMMMLAISLVSDKFGLERGFSIALFPVVILTMVIERMSIVWEETGPADALKQGCGSLFVAVIGYLVMSDPYVEHVVFLFPEVNLAVLALFLVMGRYTGYRLSELRRFRDLADEADEHAGKDPKAS